MDTPYDEFDVKHETTRKEQSSTFMSSIHTIPKKIADIAQTQGVSEKFLENGMPSGVINPSMLAHDRYLSAVDAIQDALIISIMLLILPLFSVNAFTITIFTLIMSYWFFHVSWWEKTKVWALKGSSKKYIKNTTRVYWIVFLLLMLPSAVLLWYFVFVVGGQLVSFTYINSALSVTSGIEKALAEVFWNFDIVAKNLSKNPKHVIDMSSKEYENSFIAISSIFAVTTVVSKIMFSYLYKVDQIANANQSHNEMLYQGEAALETLKQR